MAKEEPNEEEEVFRKFRLKSSKIDILFLLLFLSTITHIMAKVLQYLNALYSNLPTPATVYLHQIRDYFKSKEYETTAEVKILIDLESRSNTQKFKQLTIKYFNKYKKFNLKISEIYYLFFEKYLIHSY